MVVVTTSILVMPLQYAGMLLLDRRLVSLLPEGLGGSRVQPRQPQTRRNSLADTLSVLCGCPFVIWAVATVSVCVVGLRLLHAVGACLEAVRRIASYCSWLQSFLAVCILIIMHTRYQVAETRPSSVGVQHTVSLVSKIATARAISHKAQVMVYITNNLLSSVRPFVRASATHLARAHSADLLPAHALTVHC